MERMKNQRVNHLVHKKPRNVFMSWLTNLVEFDNANGEREHSANSPKLKRRKASASSSGFGFRSGLDGSQQTPVPRSRKRVQQVVTPTTTNHRPCTVLSWLIDHNVVLPREKVHYCSAKGSRPMAEGKVSREGIVCSCCHKVFTLGGFESHAGYSETHNRRPAANIFLDNGKSLLDCQIQLMSVKRKRSSSSEPHDRMKGNWPQGENDCFCKVCHDGGDLVLCDLCPSSFHKSCIGLKDVPDGDWFCPACRCGLCGQSILKKDREPTTHYRTCGQCEHKYHAGCLRKISLDKLESDPKGNWFCSEGCKKISSGLNELVGKRIPVGVDDLTWSLLKSDSDDTDEPNNDAITETYSRLSLALLVMHECFQPVMEPHTQRDLAEDIIFSRGSDINRMNFQGFYTVLLERNDELITVATVRIYGALVAEVPLLGTRFKYRRCGMFRLLMHLLEKMLMDLGVERLVLPALPTLLNIWTSFGYSKMTDYQRLQFMDYRFVNFEDTIICQKRLMKIPPAEPCPSKGTLFDVSGSVDNIDFDGSSGDNVSFTWKIGNFSTLLCTKKSETFLIGDLRWQILLYPKGRETVDYLSVSLDVEGGSELPLGWSRCAQFSLTVVNQLQRSKSITKETKHVFNKRGSDCGFTSLIPLSELHDHSKGYLVNDTCIIAAKVSVCTTKIEISQAQKTGSSACTPVEYSNQWHKEQGPLNMESVKVPDPSSAARKATGFENVTAFQDAASSQQVCFEISDNSTDPPSRIKYGEVADVSSAARKATGFEHVTAFQDAASSQQVCFEISDNSTDPPSRIKYGEVPDVSSAARKATGFEHVTASQDTASSKRVCIEISDTSTDPPLVEEYDVVSSTSASELMDFKGLAKIKKDFVPLLEEVCSWHPSLIECQKKSSPQFTEWAFTALGKVLHFLKTTKVKYMTRSVCEDLELLWNELKAFKFDLTWLEPHVERALGMNKFGERAAELKILGEDVNALEIESKRLNAKLVVARNDMKRAEEGFNESTMDSQLGYPYC